MLRSLHARRSGFTLIELLAVVFVIGILLSFVIPNLGRIREDTRLTTMRNTLNKIGTAQENYRSVNGDYANSLDELRTIGFELDDDIDPDGSSTFVRALPNAGGAGQHKYGWYARTGHLQSDAACGIEFGKEGPGTAVGNYLDGKIYCEASESDLNYIDGDQ